MTSNENIKNQNYFENISKIGEISIKIISNNVETIDCENISTEVNIQHLNNEDIFMGLNVKARSEKSLKSNLGVAPLRSGC